MAINPRYILAIPAGALAIISAIFAVEGGYVNDPRDPGGATNHGVTQKVAREHGYQGDMRAFPKEWAQSIYYEDYILKPGFAPIVELSLPVAEEAVDSGVNTGPAQPSRWFQIALNSLNRQQRDYADLKVDGKVGPATVAAFKRLQETRGKAKACSAMVKLMDAQQAVYYLSLTQKNDNYENFMLGWVDHRLGNIDLKRCAA